MCSMKANDLAISHLKLAQLRCVHSFCEIYQNDSYVICPACTHIIYDSVLFFIHTVPATEVPALLI